MRVLLATGRLIGEARSSTARHADAGHRNLLKGTLQQYAGRLHQEHAGKQDVRIYDYAEPINPNSAACGTNANAGTGHRIRDQTDGDRHEDRHDLK